MKNHQLRDTGFCRMASAVHTAKLSMDGAGCQTESGNTGQENYFGEGMAKN